MRLSFIYVPNIIGTAYENIAEVLHIKAGSLWEALASLLMLLKKEKPLILNGRFHIHFSLVFIVPLNGLPAELRKLLDNRWPLAPIKIKVEHLAWGERRWLIGNILTPYSICRLLLERSLKYFLLQNGRLTQYLFLRFSITKLNLPLQKLFLLL